jgi:hypothetical protein
MPAPDALIWQLNHVMDGLSLQDFGPRRATQDKVDCMGLFTRKIKQEHKVMLQHERSAGALLPENHRATPECLISVVLLPTPRGLVIAQPHERRI